MINKVAFQNTLLPPQKTRPTNPLQEMLEKNNPVKAQSLRDELAQATQILTQIQSSKTDANEQRRAAAAQKIQKLKAQIEALQMTGINDPKGTARKAAKLARELAEATREYVNAGGEPGISGNVSTNAPLSNNPPSESAQATDNTSAPTVTESQSISLSKSISENDIITVALGKTSSEEALKDSTGSGHYTTQIRNNIKDRIEQASNLTQSAEEDQAFASEVRRLVSVLKNIIKTAKNKLDRDEGNADNKDVTDAEKALAETEKLLDGGELNTVSSATAGVINILT